MPLYRVLKALSLGAERVEAGGLLPLTMSSDKIEILEARGAISKLYTPPLSELPGWERKAKALAGTVETVEEFLEADNVTLATALKLAPEDIPAMKTILQSLLFVPGEKPCNCS